MDIFSLHNILIIIVILITAMLIVVFITGKKEEIENIKEFYAMGTVMQLKAYGRKSEKAIGEALERLDQIENRMSVFKTNSDISQINKKAGVGLQKVNVDTYYVINKAISYCRLSEGAFDITIRPLVGLWRIGSENPRLPNKKEIQEKQKLVNYKDIMLDEENCSIGLKSENQAIDVGGIAKGYAADEVRSIFVKNGIKSAIINLGGNIFVLGNKADGKPWKVGIQDPLKNRGEFVGIIAASNKSIVTSGNYERYFQVEGKKYHHIIDPRTGYPSESEIISITIISDLSIDGDGLSTGLYIMGVEKAYSLIESLPSVDAIFITSDKRIYVTSGIKDNFMLTKLNDYKLQI